MLLLSIGLLGCGPVQYINQVTIRGAGALAQAERAEAERLAPFEYTMAREYLRKAREEAGYSSFDNAAVYGRRCEEMAAKARALAHELAQAPAAAAGPGEPTHR